MTFRSSFHCFELPNSLFISLSVGNNNGEASFIVHLPLMNAVKVWCDDVYTSQVYFLTTHYCYQSIEFNDMLSQIRRLNTLLFNVRKNLPPVHTENNSASVIGHAGCRRRICDRSAEAGFSIFSLCLEAGLRPPTGRQLLLLAVASRWRCCHHHDGGVWLLIDTRASGSSWCSPKN